MNYKTISRMKFIKYKIIIVTIIVSLKNIFSVYEFENCICKTIEIYALYIKYN